MRRILLFRYSRFNNNNMNNHLNADSFIPSLPHRPGAYLPTRSVYLQYYGVKQAAAGAAVRRQGALPGRLNVSSGGTDWTGQNLMDRFTSAAPFGIFGLISHHLLFLSLIQADY